MKLNFYTLALALSCVATSCVDSDYDLSNVNADGFSIGDSNTQIAAPIATVTISSDKFISSTPAASYTRADSELDFDAVISLINAFLPSGESIDLDKLTADATKDEEISRLVDTFVSELELSSSKRAELAKILFDYLNDDSLDMQGVLDSISEDIDKNATEAEILDAINDLLDSANNEANIAELKAAISDYISEEIIDYINDYKEIEIEEEIDVIDIPSEVTDILTSSLAGETSKIEIIATYEHNFPFTFNLDDGSGNEAITLYNSSATPSIITINVTPVGAAINPSEIDLDNLTAILGNGNGAKIITNINLSTYLASSADSYWIKIKISILKTGALVF